MNLKKIIALFSLPYLMLHIIFYLKYRKIVNFDIERCKEHHYDFELKGFMALVYLLCFDKAFRGIFYYRVKIGGHILNILLPSFDTLMINSNTPIDKGALLVHAFSTIINADSIGENFRISHSSTIGNSKNGKPIIKNNVTIHPGSIVFGDITIGNNVVVGAGSIINKDVPDDCTIVGNPAYIVKLKGNKVNIKL